MGERVSVEVGEIVWVRECGCCRECAKECLCGSMRECGSMKECERESADVCESVGV